MYLEGAGGYSCVLLHFVNCILNEIIVKGFVSLQMWGLKIVAPHNSRGQPAYMLYALQHHD